jgi:hypothetical protein
VSAGVDYLRDATGGYTISEDKQDHRNLVLSLVPLELADAFNNHLKARAESVARERAEYEARRAEADNREKEAAEYRRQHPEQFVFITILKDRQEDRYCNSPLVFVTRTEAEMDKILTAWAQDLLEYEDGAEDADADDDEDAEEEEEMDPVEQYFECGYDRCYEMVMSAWAKFDDVKDWEKKD